MDIRNNLIKLLNNYVKEHNMMRRNYKNNKVILSLYEELISLFENGFIDDNKLCISVLLSTIYKDDIYVDEFYRILAQNDISLIYSFVMRIKNDYDELKSNNKSLKIRMSRNYEMFVSAKRVSACLRYSKTVLKSKNDIFNIKRIISYYELSGVISSKEELLLINEIESYNRNIEVQKGSSIHEKEYADNLYNELPNILNIGFQEHDDIEVAENRKNSLDKFVFEIFNIINTIEFDQIDELLENYEVYDFDGSEYNYIIVSVLNLYMDELMGLYELLIDKEIYRNRSDRLDVIKSYQLTLEKYLIVKKYYDKISEYVPEDIVSDETVEETKKEKRLIYSHSNVNVTKSKIISDMSDIPYEYYDSVGDLISRFKSGDLHPGEVKVLKNAKSLKGHIELRYDQVRILIKHVKDDIYCVRGVFTKKEDNDIPMYKIITNRMIPDVSTDKLLNYELELANIVDKELNNLIEQKARKGTR